MEASAKWTGRCSREIEGRQYSAEVSVRAVPTDAGTSVSLAPAVEAELTRAFGPDAERYTEGVRASVLLQIGWAPVKGGLPAVEQSRFRVEVVDVVPPLGAPRTVTDFLFFIASMEAVAAYLVAFEHAARGDRV